MTIHHGHTHATRRGVISSCVYTEHEWRPKGGTAVQVTEWLPTDGREPYESVHIHAQLPEFEVLGINVEHFGATDERDFEFVSVDIGSSVTLFLSPAQAAELKEQL